MREYIEVSVPDGEEEGEISLVTYSSDLDKNYRFEMSKKQSKVFIDLSEAEIKEMLDKFTAFVRGGGE